MFASCCSGISWSHSVLIENHIKCTAQLVPFKTLSGVQIQSFNLQLYSLLLYVSYSLYVLPFTSINIYIYIYKFIDTFRKYPPFTAQGSPQKRKEQPNLAKSPTIISC